MAQLNRGSHMVELMKQAQYSPMVMEEQVASIFAGINGNLDGIPLPKVKAFETGLLAYLKSKKPEILKDIKDKNDLTDDNKAKLIAAIEEFSKTFVI
jgi:F-type H+-transporting ATPase subunit alpha